MWHGLMVAGRQQVTPGRDERRATKIGADCQLPQPGCARQTSTPGQVHATHQGMADNGGVRGLLRRAEHEALQPVVLPVRPQQLDHAWHAGQRLPARRHDPCQSGLQVGGGVCRLSVTARRVADEGGHTGADRGHVYERKAVCRSRQQGVKEEVQQDGRLRVVGTCRQLRGARPGRQRRQRCRRTSGQWCG